MKYGAGISRDGVKKQSHDKLPILIVTIELQKLIQLAKDLVSGAASDESKILENEVIKSLRIQSDSFQDLVDSELRLVYQKTEAIFKEL